MDKNAIKKYAVWARRELIEKVSQKALQYGIEEGKELDPKLDSINGVLLSDDEKKQRQALIHKINENGYTQVMEEVAYTWFNRFIALRFMEVNGYLPSHVRVFSDESGSFKPQILAEAIHLDLSGMDLNKVMQYKEDSKEEELFKYLLLVQCNALNEIIPKMFQKISDYTELLLPDYLLREGSVVEKLVNEIPEDNFDVDSENGQIEIIGWMYQYYITEKNEEVYDGSFSKSKVTKDYISAATTIYTPEWPVRYMVQNSIGHLWLEGHPDEKLETKWEYYLKEENQKEDVEESLRLIREKYAEISADKITCLDPCCGSGHILSYMFDVLIDIYESQGYTASDAAQSIVRNNLYGLDIDERAAQLASFAVMMKGRQYDRRFLSRKIVPHVISISESNNLDEGGLEYFYKNDNRIKNAMECIIDELHDSKELGSITHVSEQDWDLLYSRFEEIRSDISIFKDSALTLESLVQTAEILSKKYDIVITNPPYLGSGRFDEKLDAFVKDNYGDVKADLSMIMYKKAICDFAKKNGFVAFITTSSWMTLASFEKLRSFMQNNVSILNLVDFGTELFEGKVGHNPIVAWVTRNTRINYKICAVRLVDYCYSRRDEKEPEFHNKENYYSAYLEDFEKIPGTPIAYWGAGKFIDNFTEKSLGAIYFSGGRNKTHNNEKYLRVWWEVADEVKWQLYDKGGDFRRWYGNHEYVVDWSDEAKKDYDSHGGLYNQRFANKVGICWSYVTSGKTAFRIKVDSHHYDSGAPVIFNKGFTLDRYTLGFLNSSTAFAYLRLLNPSVNMGNTYVLSLPYIYNDTYCNEIERLVEENIEITRCDWDQFEKSVDFRKHPLIKSVCLVEEAYRKWDSECEERFIKLKQNEERINILFAQIYGVEDVVRTEVEDKDVSVSKSDLKREIKSLISYAVGCMFGRYSLEIEGLVCKDQNLDLSKYGAFQPDKDNIIPICDDEYFADDIVERFVNFIEIVYGKENLGENLNFIAGALSDKGQPKEVLRNYFMNEFYSDHLSNYSLTGSGKRPIYWMFDSGKKNGFKCLIYMQRYQSDTIARVRTDYVHEQQARYKTAIEEIEKRMEMASQSDKIKLTKKLNTLKAQDEEIHAYEEKIHHLADQMISIDLDDGVRHNYALFQDVLAKI